MRRKSVAYRIPYGTGKVLYLVIAVLNWGKEFGVRKIRADNCRNSGDSGESVSGKRCGDIANIKGGNHGGSKEKKRKVGLRTEGWSDSKQKSKDEEILTYASGRKNDKASVGQDDGIAAKE
ncbi:hypothetical protein LWI28_000895 [Acer negundo]|uniref:Uncharacterized protein n=1 Tax=Acer negundo TaxID=4023 RepID=A0AAD5JUY1_ACENE|nr:hypothetical protein LWI28_000895 [Acer negundo]KAK4860350.1 hypothetical protein QYF36_021871 [Acer negundo]